MAPPNEDRKGPQGQRKETVNERAPPFAVGLASGLALNAEGPAEAASTDARGARGFISERSDMSVVVYILLTVAIFALLGLVQKLVEGL